jgi:tRNA (guanine37-N1)-methyltransferase
MAHELAAEPWLVFACGRYEGIDARVLDEAAEHGRVDEISLGDYVLNAARWRCSWSSRRWPGCCPA